MTSPRTPPLFPCTRHPPSRFQFYAPWCGHCKKLIAPYAEAATTLKGDDDPVPLGKVDATVESALAGKFGVKGYPTLKIFRNGAVADYNGPRDAAGIVSYMRKQVGPSSAVLDDAAAVADFISETDPTAVYFYSSKGSSFPNWQAVAAQMREAPVKFGETTSEAARAEFGVEGDKNTVVLFRPTRHVSKLDEPTATLAGKFSQEELKDWVKGNALPLVAEMTADNKELFTHGGKSVVTAFLDLDYRRDPKGISFFFVLFRCFVF